MSTSGRDFTAILLERQIITRDQLAEARRIHQQTGARLEDILIRLGYASPEQVMLAWAEALGMGFIDLRDVVIPPAIIELIPESVARENIVLPLAQEGTVLKIVMCDLGNFDTIQKLQFILNKDIHPLLAPREQIIEAINRHYGQSETESVDSMLTEFTDTAIDFTATEALCEEEEERPTSIDLECFASEPVSRAALETPPEAVRRKAGPPVSRRATVRYYDRMSPERLFPLLVVLSRQAIEEVVQRGVVQAHSKAFKVEEGSLVEVEPILPGCQCYPPREQVRIGKGEATARFWVVPHVVGTLMQARVVIRQDGDVLAEVPLQARVARQGMTVVMGALSLVLPFVLLLLRHFRLDFESQLQEGFSLYAYLIDLALRALTPELLTGLLLAGTAVLYLWLRPRKRDVFWDVTPTGGSDRRGAAAERILEGFVRQEPPPATPRSEDDQLPGEFLAELLESQESMLKRADALYEAGENLAALRLFEHAFKLGRVRAIHYFRASTAAYRTGNVAHALEILLHARAVLPEAEIRGEMWYNMGCCTARLGRFPEALQYLNRAVDAGYDRPEKYREDPDLEPLRGHPSFKRFLLSAGY
jgi:hypothetical protein